jgi:two-component system phosphate regulon sensor histidine kinase PhoR
LFDIEPRFMAGKPLVALVVSEERRRFRAWLHSPVEAEHPVFRFQRRGRVSFDGELHTFPDADGLSWVIRDVTDEKQAERRTWELNRELERRVAEQAGEMATVYDQLPVGVAIMKGALGPPRLNARAQELLGETFPFDAHAQRALTGEAVHSELVQYGELALEVSAVPLRGPDEAITGAVLTFVDITRRERIDRADREFVTNASHQLRTPIAAIGSAVAALKAGAGDDPAERERFLDHLEFETGRLARIIEAMLVLSRVQRRELDAPLTLVALRPLLERLVAEVPPRPGVALELECNADAAAIAHRFLLEEAVASVLANAAEHTTAGAIRISARPLGSTMEIEIADTGPGMEPTIRERAFERFFGSTPNRRSAGLGLAIARTCVEASSGTIELESEPGAGTTVRITLPSAPLLRP